MPHSIVLLLTKSSKKKGLRPAILILLTTTASFKAEGESPPSPNKKKQLRSKPSRKGCCRRVMKSWGVCSWRRRKWWRRGSSQQTKRSNWSSATTRWRWSYQISTSSTSLSKTQRSKDSVLLPSSKTPTCVTTPIDSLAPCIISLLFQYNRNRLSTLWDYSPITSSSATWPSARRTTSLLSSRLRRASTDPVTSIVKASRN